MTDQVLVAAGVVALTGPEPWAPAELRRRDGMCVFDRHGATRYTTLATLSAEQTVVDLAEAGAGAGRGVATPSAVEEAVACSGLGPDQEAAVRAVTREGDTVVCVVGPAGAGKSRAMGAAAAAWQASGVPVRGLAVSAVAAGVLHTEAGIASDTVAKFLFEHDRPGGPDGNWRLLPGQVVVVDEAGMLASADLARLARLVEQAEAKLVLVGDHAQLGAVEAGGLFRLLVETTAVELAGVRRFAAPWEAEASLRLRSRDPSVLAVYQAHGRVQGCDRLEAAEAAVAAWHAARSAGQSVVICASDHATVDAVAARVRAGRVAAGDVEPGGVAAGELVVGTGDEIVTCRNDRRLMTTAGAWVRNGDRWVVTERFGGASLAVSSLDGRGAVVLPADYVHNEVTLAYAVTLHKAQGVTVDRAVVVADEATTAEALYVGMTRGRHDNRALVVCGHLDAEHRQQRPDAIEVLTGALKRVSAEQAALEVLRSELAASESLATLAPRLANLDAWIARETPPDPSVELQRLVARRTHLERTARPGLLSRSGRDDRRALGQLDARQEELGAAAEHRYAWCESHAETLSYRDELAAQVSDRRSALGLNAAVTEPPHLVELLGSVPGDPGERSTWAALAGRVEAYREQWGVGNDELGEPPIGGVQYLEWETAVHNAEMFGRFDALGDEHGVGLGCGIDL